MKIIKTANKYIGQFEKSGNLGFKDPKFEIKMIEDGFVRGDSWCALFQEMIWEEAYPQHEQEFDKLFHKSCVETFRRFKKAGYQISTIPKLGSLMVMQRFNNNIADWRGHVGVVTEIHSNSEWTSVEGNTNAKGSREGDSVQPKRRTLMYHPTGLRVIGFIQILETLNIQE